MELLWGDDGDEEEGEAMDDEPSLPPPQPDEPTAAKPADHEPSSLAPPPIQAAAFEPSGAEVEPAAVRARIEAVVASLLAGLLLEPPQVPPLRLSNGSSAATRRRLLHPREWASCTRLWRVLAESHAALAAGRSATQRDMYYTLADQGTVRRASEVNAAIADATRLLGVPRGALAVTTASRGVVTGVLDIREANAWSDLTDSGGRPIVGDLDWVASAVLRSRARLILVVEKDAVFNRLLQEKACRALNCVMLTARGMPDVATRAFLRRLADLLPAAPVLALVDWNPSGALILGAYRGTAMRTARTAQEARHGVDVRWLACRAADVAAMDGLIPLTARDGVLLRNLLARLEGQAAQAGVAAELQEMAARGVKAELEALYSADRDLTPLLLRKLLRGDYV